MFGYIRTHTPELKVKDRETYRGIYCSLCDTLGKRYGLVARLLLSYDCTFLCVFLMSLNDNCPGFKKGRCVFNPAKKCKKVHGSQNELNFAADVSVLLTAGKIKDNIGDSSFIKSLFYRFIYILLLPYFKKAKRLRPDIYKITAEYISAQQKCEKEKCTDIDLAAEPTGKMLAELLSLVTGENENKDGIMHFGYLTGRWIYLADAFDDIEKDRKSNNYNVFLLSGKTDRDEITKDLLMTAGEVFNKLSDIRMYKFKDIIENITEDGLYFETVRISQGGKKR